MKKKYILRKRKHRNGARPTRKGSLKVNLITLPTEVEHTKNIQSLMEYREKNANLDEAHEHMNAGRWTAFRMIISQSRSISNLISSLQKADLYFAEYRQIAPIDIALKVINEDDLSQQEPGQPANACATCCLKYRCPFAPFADQLENFCPFVRKANLDHANRALNEKELTPFEMAALAVHHLS